MLYMVTFTINILQMSAYIPYMDPMRLGKIPQFALDLLHSEVHCIPQTCGKPETSLAKKIDCRLPAG